MVNVDSVDKRLIRLLQEDAGRSSAVLARRLKVSPATVRRRTSRLIKNQVIRIGAVADPKKVGLPLAAIMAIDVVNGKLDSVFRTLTSKPEVIWVSTTTGRFDVIAMVRFPSIDELARFVQSELSEVDGIRDSETFICLHFESKPEHYS